MEESIFSRLQMITAHYFWDGSARLDDGDKVLYKFPEITGHKALKLVLRLTKIKPELTWIDNTRKQKKK